MKTLFKKTIEVFYIIYLYLSVIMVTVIIVMLIIFGGSVKIQFNFDSFDAFCNNLMKLIKLM